MNTNKRTTLDIMNNQPITLEQFANGQPIWLGEVLETGELIARKHINPKQRGTFAEAHDFIQGPEI